MAIIYMLILSCAGTVPYNESDCKVLKYVTPSFDKCLEIRETPSSAAAYIERLTGKRPDTTNWKAAQCIAKENKKGRIS